MSRDNTRSEPYGGRFTKETPSNGDAENVRRGRVRRAMIAGTVGTAIEWYDFFLYGTAAALVFPPLFFPKRDPYTGALRRSPPRGGFRRPAAGRGVFGHCGDRIGRKATLISTLLPWASPRLIGVLPSTASASGRRPCSSCCACMQGIGVGGEWGGSVCCRMEWGDPGAAASSRAGRRSACRSD